MTTTPTAKILAGLITAPADLAVVDAEAEAAEAVEPTENPEVEEAEEEEEESALSWTMIGQVRLKSAVVLKVDPTIPKLGLGVVG
jgi:carbamoylphosphate synthase large subunit